MWRKMVSIFLFAVIVWGVKAEDYILSPGSSVIFEKEDKIKMDIYDWPRTLVSYRVKFEGKVITQHLKLRNLKTGRFMPFQLSEKKEEGNNPQEVIISFFAELPSGGYYRYELKEEDEKGEIKQELPVTIRKENDQWIIGNSGFGVTVPDSRTVNAGEAPAPILSLLRETRSTGQNRIYSTGQNIKSIRTEFPEKGELFVTCRIDYLFEDGAAYQVKLKIIQGYPFVIMEEKMVDFSPADTVYVDMCWTRFTPAYRFGTQWDRVFDKKTEHLGIAEPVYTNYSKEDPHWTGMGWREDPTKQMIFRLTPFGGNSVREQTPVMSFWEKGEEAAEELSIFVFDHKKWDDRQYGIWQPTTELCVYFRHENEKLHFTYPLKNGTRSTALALYPVREGERQIIDFNKKIDKIAKEGGAHPSDQLVYRYGQLLHQQYASLSLDRIKDWQLAYDESGRRPQNLFPDRVKQSPEAFYKAVTTSAFAYYPMGLNFYPGIHSIEHRLLYSKLVEGYLYNYKLLSSSQRETIEGLFLMGAYVNTLEEMNAIRTSLAGTANMAADGWCVPPQMSYLFPEHPMAKEWMDFFEKSLELYGLFYTRPPVKQYNTRGGRWAESLGIYNWAYLRPTSHTNIASELYDGKNRFANIHMAERGRWMVDMLSAPVYNLRHEKNKSESYPKDWKPGQPLLESMGFRRQYPAHGAHGGGTTVDPPASLYQLGVWMKNYDPMLAEHIFWVTKEGKDLENKVNDSDWFHLFKGIHKEDNTGTNPQLKSVKYTGHGIVLRAGTDTPDELSIHLEQVDKGPNYRWGNQGEGNSGGIYFYARGQLFTGHENELAGDHVANNLDGVSNFGVMKNGEFRTIGMNELESPLYDFGIAQFAEVTSARGKDIYSWPEYESRSILLVGNDYFLIFDQTGTNWRTYHRFSWFVANEHDFPNIVFLSPKARDDHWMTAQTPNSKGFYRDAAGSLLTLVTHKKNEVSVMGGKLKNIPLLNTENVADFIPDKENTNGVIHIQAPQSKDILFRDRKNMEYDSQSEAFTGKAGMIRRMNDGTLQMALFKGQRISADGLTMEISSPEIGISLIRQPDGKMKGRFNTLSVGEALFKGVTASGHFYIDGERQTIIKNGDIIRLSLPPGDHSWEYTSETPIPMKSVIVNSIYEKKGVRLKWENPNSHKEVRLELSYDNGKTWISRLKTTRNTFLLPKEAVAKVHVRAVSVNGNKAAEEAPEYPVYFTGEPPHYPEGLCLKIDSDKVHLSWGKVLGVEKYRLYRKVNEKALLIYEGIRNCFTDSTVKGLTKPCTYPGKNDNLELSENQPIYEYYVTAVNGNGESLPGVTENTDPTSWKNWYPNTLLKFKRQSAFWMPPYVPENSIPDKYYPE